MSQTTGQLQTVNRMVAVLKPKKPYLDWINSLPGMDKTPVTFEDLNRECSCCLLPEYDDNEQGREFILKNSQKIFEVELGAWDNSGEDWPEKLDRRLFKEFFDIEVHSELIDLMKGPIEREDFF